LDCGGVALAILRPLGLAVAVIVSERVPFLEEDSILAARLYNESGRRRGTLADCMIAATSLRLKAPIATVNPSDFSRFEDAGLTVLTA
jgi:predicted nucleic acid-binding protein